jgi:hypothetical protein
MRSGHGNNPGKENLFRKLQGFEYAGKYRTQRLTVRLLNRRKIALPSRPKKVM